MITTTRSRSAREVSRLREKYGEQHYHVQHYLALWKADRTQANWDRLLGAVEGWQSWGTGMGRDALLRRGHTVYTLNHQRRLTRWRMGPRGGIYSQTFRKTSASWPATWSSSSPC